MKLTWQVSKPSVNARVIACEDGVTYRITRGYLGGDPENGHGWNVFKYEDHATGWQGICGTDGSLADAQRLAESHHGAPTWEEHCREANWLGIAP